MDADKPRRPWWRHKRAWAALALWLLAMYPLSHGPAGYAARRGWISEGAADAYTDPVVAVLWPEGFRPTSPARRVVARAYRDWINWWDGEGSVAASHAEDTASGGPALTNSLFRHYPVHRSSRTAANRPLFGL